MITYASHGPSSAARAGGRLLRGSSIPAQPINTYLEQSREDWDLLSSAERIDRLRGQLLFLADPVTHLDEFDDDILADLTLGELQHARRVLSRLLRVGISH